MKSVKLDAARKLLVLMPGLAASEDDWSTEYLAPIVSIKAVAGVDEAIEHIQKFGTGHTESIISENKDVNQNSQNLSIVRL